MKIDSLAKGIFFASLLLSTSCASHAESELDKPTGVCFRRLSSVVNGTEYSSYEIVLKSSSGQIDKDISRINMFYVKNGPMKNPHLKSFVWLSAFLYDRKFDGVHGPSCAGLPEIQAVQAR